MAGVAGRSGTGKRESRPWRDAIMRAVKRRIAGKGSPQALEVLADKVVELGLDGDVSALKEIGDRLDGRPVQAQAHSGDGEGAPIPVLIHTGVPRSAEDAEPTVD